MAVCNILNKLVDETGTFLVFSQYLEDITQWTVKSSGRKVSPSKFVALDIQPNIKGDFDNTVNLGNESTPKVLQDYFENAVASFKKTYNSEDVSWTSKDFTDLFWDVMFSKFIKVEDIKYYDDINLQSYDNVDGMGHSEIYCHIPNNCKLKSYKVQIAKRGIDNRPVMNANSNTTNNKMHVLEGFGNVDLTSTPYNELKDWLKLPGSMDYNLSNSYTMPWDVNDSYETIEADSYNINTMIVLYDILDNENNYIARNIPMGIYFTGKFDDATKIIKHSITKYISNGDIYDAGTSYGLRICTRFAISSTNSTMGVTVDTDRYSDINNVLYQLSVTQSKMNDVVNKVYSASQINKDLLGIFKNSRTNVPYVKLINGENYWYINGQLTAKTSGSVPSDYNDMVAKVDELMDKVAILQGSLQQGTVAVFSGVMDMSSSSITVYETLPSGNGGNLGGVYYIINDAESFFAVKVDDKYYKTWSNEPEISNPDLLGLQPYYLYKNPIYKLYRNDTSLYTLLGNEMKQVGGSEIQIE